MRIKREITTPDGDKCAAAGIKCGGYSCNTWRLVRDITGEEGLRMPHCHIFDTDLELVINGKGYTINKCPACLNAEKVEG